VREGKDFFMKGFYLLLYKVLTQSKEVIVIILNSWFGYLIFKEVCFFTHIKVAISNPSLSISSKFRGLNIDLKID